jgi:hypothetical protein
MLQCKFFLARNFMLMLCVIDPEWLSSCSFFGKSAISIFFKFEPLHVGRFAVGERLLKLCAGEVY